MSYSCADFVEGVTDAFVRRGLIDGNDKALNEREDPSRAADLVFAALDRIDEAVVEAKAALVGDSNDAEHDALVSFAQAMGLEIPECDCDERSWHGEGHDSACPQRAWQKEGN
jgi:hypothetical protein